MEWWSEICPPGGVPSVRFGGPTGIYALVVLLSWWCTLLKGKTDKERADYLQTTVAVNHAFLAAINGIKNHPTTLTPSLLPPTDPPPPSLPRKRVNSETVLKNRKRPARV